MALYIISIPIVLIFLFANYFIPRIIIQLRGGIFSYIKPKVTELAHPDDFLLNSEKIDIVTKDNLYLSAYLIKTEQDTQKGTIILLHGIRSCKENNLPVCKYLADEGYNSVIIDLRAHGASQGKFCTFGFYEKHDIVTLIDTLYNVKNLNLNIGIWGQSLGGAISLQTLEIDKRLKFGIIESTFTDFRTIIHDYFFYHMKFKLSFFTNYMINRAGRIAKFKVSEIQPLQSAKSITQPILLAHGEEDKKIDIKYGKEIFKVLQNKNNKFISIPKAGHSNLKATAGDNYIKEVILFIDKNFTIN